LDKNTTFLRYIPNGQAYFEIDTPNGQLGFVATVSNNISLVKVPNEYVGNMLLRKTGCCGQEKIACKIATQEEIDKWLGRS